jgi:hypothetical protein
MRPELKVIAVKNFIRILLKALMNGVLMSRFRDQPNILPAGEAAMTSSPAGINQRHASHTQCIGSKLAPRPAPSSIDSAETSDEPSRSFLAVLLRCLAAPNA